MQIGYQSGVHGEYHSSKILSQTTSLQVQCMM